MATEDEILHKVRSLLAKAESTTYEAESMACMEKAHHLMRTYSLDRAVVESHNMTFGRGQDITTVVIEVSPPYVKAKVMLVGAISRGNGCRPIKVKNSVHVYGLSYDLRYVQIMYTSLLLQAINSLVDMPTPYGENTKAYRNAFLLGYAMEINRRLEEVNKVVESDNRAAVVLLRDMEADIKAVMREDFPHVSHVRYAYTSREGYGDGQREGNVADIGQQTVGESVRGEISG